MGSTIQLFSTLILARELLSTLHPAALLAAGTSDGEGGGAGWAGSGVAQLHAGVGTGRGAPPPAHLPAAVRHHALVPVPLGVAQLAAEAEIFPRNERVDALAAGAAPAPVFCTGRLRPLLDAMDVEDLIAIVTVPGGMVLLHPLQADHALGQTTDQLVR